MRIAIGGFCHETNGFGNIRADKETLDRVTVAGNSIPNVYGKSRSFSSGYLEGARDLGVELVPTRMVYLIPAGPTEQTAFENFRDAMVADMTAAQALNAPLELVRRVMQTPFYQILLKNGIDNRTLDSLKKNGNITMLTLEKLCNILHCTANEIIIFR